MDQNQTTPPPNYDFIMNQPGPHGEAPGQSPKRNKTKLIIGIVLLILVIVTVPLAYLATKNKNPQTPVAQTTPSLENKLNDPTTSDQQATVQNFLKDIKAQQYEAAFAYLEQTPAVVAEKQKYISQTAPAIGQLLNVDNCAISTPDQKDPNTVEVTCLFATGGRGVYDFTMTQQNGKYLIKEYKTKEIVS